MRRSAMQRAILSLLLMSVYASPSSVYAIDEHILFHEDDRAAFNVRFFDPADGDYYAYDPDNPGPYDGPSTRIFTALEKEKMLKAVQYWADIIKPATNDHLAVLNVGSSEQPNNAIAFSYLIENKESPMFGNPLVMSRL